MANAKSKSKKAPKVEVNPQVARILESTDVIRPNVQAFVNWIVDQGGPEMDLEHTQVVISSYKHFQKSDAAVAYREEVGQTREQEKAARDAAREEKRKEREARLAEEKAAKTTKAAAKTKVTKGKKSAAAESVPAAKPAAKKAVAKKAPAKKRTATRKASF